LPTDGRLRAVSDARPSAAQAQKPTSVDRLIESESVSPSPEDAAIAFLKTKLGDGKPHPVVQVHNDADAAGVDPDALHRARNMLPIQSRFGPGRPSTWMMEMDQAPAPPDESIPPAKPVNPDPPPAPVFEEHRHDELIKAVPGMRLDVLMSLQRK
jgi:hypothetical protein